MSEHWYIWHGTKSAMKLIWRAVAAVAIAAAGAYVLKKVFFGRRVKEALWSNNLPISFSDKTLMPKSSYKMTYPILWAGKE